MTVLDHCNNVIVVVVAVDPFEFSLLVHVKFYGINQYLAQESS
jgi:hypothetical protein